MKSLKFQKFSFSEADVLSKLQMKKIKGGHGSASGCVPDGTICHEEDGIKYQCSTQWINEQVECCCGASAGDDNCSNT